MPPASWCSTKTYVRNNYDRLCARIEKIEGGQAAYEAVDIAYKQILADVEAYRTPEVAGPDYEADFQDLWTEKQPYDALSILFAPHLSSPHSSPPESRACSPVRLSAIALGGTSQFDSALVFGTANCLTRVASTLHLTHNRRTLQNLRGALVEVDKALQMALEMGTTDIGATLGGSTSVGTFQETGVTRTSSKA